MAALYHIIATTHQCVLFPTHQSAALAPSVPCLLAYANYNYTRLSVSAVIAPTVSTVPIGGAILGKPTILVAEKLGAAGLELLSEFANMDCCCGLSPEELCAKIPLCDMLIVRSGTKVGHDMFEAFSGILHVVVHAGVGIDNVNLATATEHGIFIVILPHPIFLTIAHVVPILLKISAIIVCE
ncbi:hypothetical protein GUJ93_ZPchr0006g45671 [Zizania palustris]|uniref:D-isomer specific 2-hydroxyacid dehydrogenase catalytic domain-containing protein n=1 Tax=Zizania palustris TaxID=103762 RepID=A0A8J5TAQ2_ZIZPA|nr:hypothetical protein GUJ93_ZPchr0006g45671 [Zizania palustris]